MKIRKGFVSNSSSSSFVVAFPKKPKTVEDVKKMLFGNERYFSHPYNNEQYFTDQVAQTIFDLIKEQKTANKKDIFKAIKCGYFDGHADYNQFKKKEVKGKNSGFDIDWEAYTKENDRRAMLITEEFIEKNSNKIIYTFSFSDNDGSYYSALEHGNVFGKLNHIRTSCH